MDASILELKPVPVSQQLLAPRNTGAHGLGYSAWIIDLDGTLYRSLWVRIAMACELVGASPVTVRILRTFRRHLELLRDNDADFSNDPYQVQVIRTANSPGVSRERVAQTVQKWMFTRPAKWLRLFRRRALFAAILQFRNAGGKTALVSDYPAALKLRALAAENLFDVVIACGEGNGPPRLKPSPDGLVAAAQQLGVHPGEALVIGDRYDVDGEAAHRAGMAFCHVTQFGRDGTFVVRSSTSHKDFS